MTGPDLAELLSRLRSVAVGVVGDFCLDAYWQLDTGTPELSLETGRPTMAVARQQYSLGGAGNVVNNLTALGVGKVRAFCVIGIDLFGDEMLRQVEAIHADYDGILRQKSDWQTSVYAKPYQGREEQNRIDFGRFNTLSPDSERKLIATVSRSIGELDALVVNQQIPRSVFTPLVIEALNNLAQQHPQKVFLVDSRNTISHFRSMVCKVNAIEAAALFGKKIHRNEECSSEDLRSYAGRLFDRFQKPVFITRSQLGLLLFDGLDAFELPALEIDGPIDPVGAGDTVVAAVAAALASGATPHQAGSLGMLAAAITVRKLRQTGSATPEEILTQAQHSLSSRP